MVSPISTMFYLLLFLFVLPSGSVLGIPVKILLTMGIIFFIVIESSRVKNIKLNRSIVLILIILCIMCVWAAISVVNGYNDGLKSILISFFSLLAVIIIAQLCFDNGWADVQTSFNVLRIAAASYVAFKLLLEVMLIVGVISYDMCDIFFRNVLDAEWMSLQFNFGSIPMYRITTSNDTIPLIVYCFDIALKKRRLLYRISMIAVMFLYVMIVYSRVIIVQFAFITVFSIFIFIKNGGITVKNAVMCISAVFIVIFMCVFLIYYQDGVLIEYLKETFLYRFSGKQVEYSDGARNEQGIYLLNGFMQSPAWGHGLGAYVKDCVRSHVSPYSYELEYVSYLYEFGIIGFFLIIGGFMFVFYKMSVGLCKHKSAKLLLMVNFLIWAAKPLFNPSFLSSTSGMTIVTFMVLALYYNNVYTGKAGIINE